MSQHAVGLNPKTLYDFLKCAAPFEGELSGYDEKITNLMIAAGVLTANEREGAPDAWRDYQQLLAELGLIYSTNVVRALTLTELGHMFLAGELGFSELIGTQALRYQYPNGQKSIIQSRLRTALEAGSITAAGTLTEFQASQGILLKPGTLILRVLLELLSAGHTSLLTTSECQAFLLPCKTNQEWPAAYAEILAHRNSTTNIEAVNRHTRRNVQDWYKLLCKSDFFESGGSNVIRLTSYAMNNLALVQSYCELQEDAHSYWIPRSFDPEGRRQWFDWFGHLSYETQTALRTDVTNESDYVSANYVSGAEDEEDETTPSDSASVNLTPLDLAHLGRDTAYQFAGDLAALVESLRKGAQKRHAKTVLHDRIIKELAETFIAQGAKVESDPNSIDLFAAWPDGNSAIFEVKTVTRRSLQGRLRSAIGQVEEYAYRRHMSGAMRADKVVVINTELTSSAWQIDFMTRHLGIGLICKSPRTYRGFAADSLRSQSYWAP